jgi:hypothetical protein
MERRGGEEEAMEGRSELPGLQFDPGPDPDPGIRCPGSRNHAVLAFGRGDPTVELLLKLPEVTQGHLSGQKPFQAGVEVQQDEGVEASLPVRLDMTVRGDRAIGTLRRGIREGDDPAELVVKETGQARRRREDARPVQDPPGMSLLLDGDAKREVGGRRKRFARDQEGDLSLPLQRLQDGALLLDGAPGKLQDGVPDQFGETLYGPGGEDGGVLFDENGGYSAELLEGPERKALLVIETDTDEENLSHSRPALPGVQARSTTIGKGEIAKSSSRKAREMN